MENVFDFTSVVEESFNKLWGAHFAVPDVIAQVFIGGGSKRVVCRLNDALEYQCALVSRGDNQYVITVNKANRDKLGLKPGSPLRVRLWKDESEYGLPVPEEFAELLKQDEEGNTYFHALTAGKQRNILYLVNQGKTPDKRIDLGIVVLEHLKKMNGKLDFKILYNDLKTSKG